MKMSALSLLSFGLLTSGIVLTARPARADWHTGRVAAIEFGYDGRTVQPTLTGFSHPQQCTCYSTWNNICLDRNRPTFKEELAALYLAMTAGYEISLNIDETTCFVQAVGLHGPDY